MSHHKILHVALALPCRILNLILCRIIANCVLSRLSCDTMYGVVRGLLYASRGRSLFPFIVCLRRVRPLLCGRVFLRDFIPGGVYVTRTR